MENEAKVTGVPAGLRNDIDTAILSEILIRSEIDL